jgi:phosphotransferase system HPr (HPr) family protein
MTDSVEKIDQVVKVGSKSGLHARPAAMVVQKAKEFQSAITFSKGDKTVNAKSILSVLSLGAEQGDLISVTISGSDAWQAMDALVAMLEKDLG